MARYALTMLVLILFLSAVILPYLVIYRWGSAEFTADIMAFAVSLLLTIYVIRDVRRQARAVLPKG